MGIGALQMHFKTLQIFQSVGVLLQFGFHLLLCQIKTGVKNVLVWVWFIRKDAEML